MTNTDAPGPSPRSSKAIGNLAGAAYPDPMTDAAIDTFLSEYLADKPPRVWSLVVTLFGDLAQDPGANLSGALLTQMFEAIGIKPDALRVALFRLRKDGWIVSARTGRASNYALTDWGRAQCVTANPLIYGTPSATQKAYLAIADPAVPLDHKKLGLHPVSGTLYLSDKPLSSSSALVVELTREQAIPEWVSDRLCPPSLVQAAAEFLDRLELIETRLAVLKSAPPLEVALIRGLIVHDWRRIALKIPQIGEFLLSEKWKGDQCRRRVHKILKELELPPAASLNQCI